VSVHTLYNYICLFTIVWNRGAQILGSWLPWWLNFVCGCRVFEGPQYGTCAMTSSGSWNFEVAPNFWKYVCPWCEVHVITSVYMCSNFHTCPLKCSASFGLVQRRVYRCKKSFCLFSLYVFKRILSTEAQLFGLSVSPTTVFEIR